MSENLFFANIHASEIRSQELWMGWLAHFPLATFLYAPRKWLFSNVLSAFEYLLVFSVFPLGQTSLLLPWCSSWAHVGAEPPWHLHFVPYMHEDVCRVGKEMLGWHWGVRTTLLSCVKECIFPWTLWMTLNYGFPTYGPELKHIYVFRLSFSDGKFFLWEISYGKIKELSS